LKKLLILVLLTVAFSQRILVPMDLAQSDHLKAYGIAFWVLQKNVEVEWLLNFRGGSFLMDHHQETIRKLKLAGVSYELVGTAEQLSIYGEIESNNMEMILLEKAPKIAIYTPPNKQPWDDAVTLALTYAEVEYETLWDAEVLAGELSDYDWLHLHHEDFTGQYGKFYKSYHNAAWYIEQQAQFEIMAQELGFPSVQEEKKAVARAIKKYVADGGFIFAMCSATDSFDIALAAENTDIAATVYDHSPADPAAQQKLDFTKSLAFQNFTLIPDPLVYEHSNVDFPPGNSPGRLAGAEADYFTLFEFSAKYDPVPTMLTQNHVNVVRGFMGQTTGFLRETIKQHIVVLGEVEGAQQVKYIHGNFGKGTFTFYGGHDPEDYRHMVGDPPTNLNIHRNSPGYRLILNNILFPAAKKKEQKT